ncbi:MAG TPA: hypothetical protein VFC72_02660 [Corynebacterium sp.]|nr:hypothetical protein [Corynebacterium sp.]
MSLNPYLGITLSLVGVGASLWLFDTVSGPEAENSALLETALVAVQDLPVNVVATDTTIERSLEGTYQVQLGLETTWDEQCAAALSAGSEEFSAEAAAHRTFELDQQNFLNPAYPASVSVDLIATSVPTDGHLNPAAAYLSYLGQVCGGVELSHPERWSYQGVPQSGHEFSTVVFSPEGEVWRTLSAYAVPGYIVWVDGMNVSIDQVREISARQTEILSGADPFTRPLGHYVPGAVDILRDLAPA